MRTTDPRLENFRAAYLRMAHEAKYRPAAPSDGCGNIQGRLWSEAVQYAVQFLREEDTGSFRIGCSDFRTAQAFCWTIEAARLLASGDGGNAAALAILRMAANEVARVVRQIAKQRKSMR
jgi:hypothetical protein